MAGREAAALLLLVLCGLAFAGCIADTAGSTGGTTPGAGARATTTAFAGENQTYAYAKSLVPQEIPGFVLQSRAKEPLTIWEDPYHFHSYWTPANASTFNGSVGSLSVDVFVYTSRDDAVRWLRAFEADADGPLAIQGVNTTYRYRDGTAEIAFMTGDIIVYCSAVSVRTPAGGGTADDAARAAAMAGAGALIRNMP